MKTLKIRFSKTDPVPADSETIGNLSGICESNPDILFEMIFS